VSPSRRGVPARRVAAEALLRIDDQGAYANLVVPAMLGRSDLDTRDRAFVTELVYGTTRMRRACDWLVDRFVTKPPDPAGRAWLRLGAYQLVFLDTPAHAAVGATVEAAPKRLAGFLNAVLRRVAAADRDWPDDATRLSYPDWLVRRLQADLGAQVANAALEAMNLSSRVTTRPDGYVQDLASQWVADAVGAGPDERVLDVAAAPGGKTTALATTGALVVAADARESRIGLVTANARLLRLGNVRCVVADGTNPPFAPGGFDRVLVDAPCSGLGVLHRRPDARWRLREEDITHLADLQRRMLDAAVELVRPSGLVVYSVCTLSRAETVDIDGYLLDTRPDLEAVSVVGQPWEPAGRGARLLPQRAHTDGMYLLALRQADPGR
jgi:16S rRNA (cytosine967-C5)-methyltransferase